MSKVLLIDSNALLHRSFHALPPLQSASGKLTNAIYGFFSTFLGALDAIKPDYVFATFDLPGPTFRHKEYIAYKAKRVKAPEEFYEQIEPTKELLRVLRVPVLSKESFEADDIIATLDRKIEVLAPDAEIFIVTGDLDTLQLVDGNTKVYTLGKGIRNPVIYNEEKVFERFSLKPTQIVDLKSLKGDPSDNIPGVKGIGEKTAIDLLRQFGSVDAMYKAIDEGKIEGIKPRILEKLKNQKEECYFSRELATIRIDAPIEFSLEQAKVENFSWEKAEPMFREYRFNSLIKRFPVRKVPIIEEKKFFQQLQEKDPESKIVTLTPTGGHSEIDTISAQSELEDLRSKKILTDDLYNLEKELIPVFAKMEERGIKIDPKVFFESQAWVENKQREVSTEIFSILGEEFNLNSPAQMGVVLKRKFEIANGAFKKTKSGEISTRSASLKKLQNVSPAIALIEEYRQLTKINNTYLKPIPELRDENNRVHPHLHQFGTLSGRISCSEPNLQAIPKRADIATLVRKGFVADEGYNLISLDYSQMELRIAAFLAKDELLTKYYKEEKDVHKMTASVLLNIPVEEVTDKQRSLAKTLNFGIIYGMGRRRLAEAVSISLDEAEQFIESYFANFSGIRAYIDAQKEKARLDGYVESYFGRRRYLPTIWSANPGLRSEAERVAVNHPIQSTGADIVKKGMLLISKGLDPQDYLLLQIHDEIILEVRKEKSDEVCKKAQEYLESILDTDPKLAVRCNQGSNLSEI